MPFVFPIPQAEDADIITKTAIADFSDSILLEGELNVAMSPVASIYNVNAMRLVRKSENGEDQENSNDSDKEGDLPPHEFIEKELIEILTASMEEKRQEDEVFDALYGNLDPELLIKELKFFYSNTLKNVCFIGLTVLANLNRNGLVILAGNEEFVYKLTMLFVVKYNGVAMRRNFD